MVGDGAGFDFEVKDSTCYYCNHAAGDGSEDSSTRRR